MIATRSTGERFVVKLALFLTVVWWGFSTMRSAIGLIVPRDAVAYAVGALALIVVFLVAARMPARGSLVSLAAFAIYTIVQFVARDDYGKVALTSLIQIVFPIGFVCIGYVLWQHRRYDTGLKTYVVTMALSAAIGLMNLYTGFAEPLFLLGKIDRAFVGSEVVQRGQSLAGGSIATGLLVGLGTIAALALPRRFWVVIPIFAFSMLGTLSRGGIIAIVTGVPVFLWFSLPPPGTRRTRILRNARIAAAAVVALGLVGSLLTTDKTGNNVFLERYVFDLFNPNEQGNATRLASWQNDIDVWSREPIFGTGLGTLGTIGATAAAEAGKGGRAAESWYLQILGELGVFGLALYLLALFGTLMDGWQAISKGRPGPDRTLAVASLGGLISLAMGGIILQNLSDLVGTLFWYFAGGLLAYSAELRKAPGAGVPSARDAP